MSENVGVIGMAPSQYPRKLAVGLLQELHTQFMSAFPPAQVEAANRPYAMIRFDSQIQRVRKSYQDVRAPDNLARLQSDVSAIASIMQTSMQEVLERGQKLEKMSLLSGTLSAESRRYVRDAKDLNWQLLKRKYGPPAILALLLLCFFYLYFYWL